MLKVLIVDDEPEVRDLLGILLKTHPELEIVAEAGNVDEAVSYTLKFKPDLILLDIQMPDKDGFSYIQEIKNMGHYPGIIFITAFENYAIQAIKSAAFDYLLKPVNKKELFASIERFKEDMERNRQPDLAEIIHLINKSRPGRVKFNTRTGYSFIDPDDIMFCEAEGNYTRIQLLSGKFEVTSLILGNVEKLLDSPTFIRISRSYLINMRYISRVDRKSNYCELEYCDETYQIKIPSQKIKLLEGYF